MKTGWPLLVWEGPMSPPLLCAYALASVCMYEWSVLICRQNAPYSCTKMSGINALRRSCKPFKPRHQADHAVRKPGCESAVLYILMPYLGCFAHMRSIRVFSICCKRRSSCHVPQWELLLGHCSHSRILTSRDPILIFYWLKRAMYCVHSLCCRIGALFRPSDVEIAWQGDDP